jgi:hypothetical protein
VTLLSIGRSLAESHNTVTVSGVQTPLSVQLPAAPQVALGLPVNPVLQFALQTLPNWLKGLSEQLYHPASVVLAGGLGGVAEQLTGVQAPT